MTLPTIILGVVISSLYGSVFHLWRGGNFWRLLLYIFLAWIGFWLGHIIGNQLEWTFGSIGTLRLGMASIGTFVSLLLGYWLSLVDRKA